MAKDEEAWWKTKIIKSSKNKLLMRGYRIEELMGNIGYGELVYLLIMGDLPHPEIARLMEAILVAGADHGVLAPSVAVSRMAATCGIPLNCCIATGVNLLGDIHGGASEQLMKLLYELEEKSRVHNIPPVRVIEEACQEFKREKRFIPGFGHPVHDDDPRVRRLFSLVEWAKGKGRVTGIYVEMTKMMAETLRELYSKSIPINVDGACAAVQCEMKLPWECAKGLFSLSRAAGLAAEALEEFLSGSRLKGPMHPRHWETELIYQGPAERDLPQGFKKNQGKGHA